jgi:predicted transglutaminase-like cysteine proteinase
VQANALETMDSVTRRKMLDQVNRTVNGRVRAVTDMTRYGVEELWNRTGMERGAAGDCEDFAIEKREQLIARGYPTKDLFFAVAFRADLGLHAVLVAHTDEGDFVLDNRNAYVTPWAKAPYVWVKRQSQEDPTRWGLVDDSAPALAPAPRGREMQMAALSPELAMTAASAGQ